MFPAFPELDAVFFYAYLLYFLPALLILPVVHALHCRHRHENPDCGRQIIRGVFGMLLIDMVVAVTGLFAMLDASLTPWMLIHLGTSFLLTAWALYQRSWYLRPAEPKPQSAPSPAPASPA